MADGYFYLGKELAEGEDSISTDSPNYDYKVNHLTTHAMVLGMTGSGKTGLCLDMMEEAIGENVPLIIVDPKGDISNLSLLFPEFSAEDFAPWVNPTEAVKKGMSLEDYAADVANTWKKGTGSWGVTPEQIKNIKEKADLKIFTPGSSAGNRISILEGFKKPEGDFEADEEEMIEKIRNSVSALLALLDVDNDPLKSKPHILISNIIEHYWRLGRSLSIEDLIINLQKPPIRKMGVFDIDQVIDEKERTELAYEINNIVASPGFRFWTTGTPLNAEVLYTPTSGKVPVNIFYIAHLSDSERMFFLTLLLNEIVYWMRRQKGAGQLKYMFYMDEIFGYLPPYPKNPPSKQPLLTLLKQARAFGLGLVLATQNPKDIDYKGLTNMGTWFVGKLQAQGDRERVMEGLSGLTDAKGNPLDDSELNDIITRLGSRRFLVKNVHRAGVKRFQTRWAMSYLAGPLSREQVKSLTRDSKKASNAAQPPLQAAAFQSPVPQPAVPHAAAPPPPGAASAPGPGSVHLLSYEPKPGYAISAIYGRDPAPGSYYSSRIYLDGEVIFDEQKLGAYIRKPFYIIAPLMASVNWDDADIRETAVSFDQQPHPNIAGYEPLETEVNYTMLRRLQSSLKNHLFANLTLEAFANKELNLVSNPDESREAFKLRCRDVVEKSIDKELEKVKEKYERKIDRIEDRMEREEMGIARLKREHSSKRTEEFLSAGESVLGLLLGKSSRRGLSAAARKRRSTSAAAGRVKEKKARLSQLEEDLLELKEELEDKVADIEDELYEKADAVEPLEIRLEKNDIIISHLALLWMPVKK